MNNKYKRKLFDHHIQENVNRWLLGKYDQDTKDEINRLIKEKPEEIVDSFYKNLEFGTGGLRGIMGIGCNRMNKYTVRIATQGMSNYIRKQCDDQFVPSVFIGYDSRHNSQFFAKESAKVLAANNIQVYLFDELRPLPLISFGCRHKGCIAAIMITASHNPPQYNGYKAYWDDGAQVLHPHDLGIIEEVNKITDLDQVKIADEDHPLIKNIGNEIDIIFLDTISNLQQYPEQNISYGNELKVVYTSLHGTGITMVPQALSSWGFNNVVIVEEQKIPDGDFPTVKSPNPEEHEALELGIQYLKQIKGDILVGTDPDCDRMGIAILHRDDIVLLTGNQIAVLCIEYICKSMTRKKVMPENAAFIKTIVTTELFRKIAEKYQKECYEVLTGFKYIAEMIRKWERSSNGPKYVFGAEESYGYLLGTHVRDKDAIIASNLICEIALFAKLRGKTLIDLLYDIYKKYGIHRESLVNLKFQEGKEGSEKMQAMMQKLRESPPKVINGMPIICIEDYQNSIKHFGNGQKECLNFSKSNVLRFWLKDDSKITIRPSGTEPKVKLYFEVVNPYISHIEEEIRLCDEMLKKLKDAVLLLFDY